MTKTKNNQDNFEAGFQGVRRTFKNEIKAVEWLGTRGFKLMDEQWSKGTYYGGTVKAYCREL